MVKKRNPAFDKDGYVTEAVLTSIGGFKGKPIAWLDLCASVWDETHGGTVSEVLTPEERTVIHADPTKEYLRFATGGWSGNEDVITLMRHNSPYWNLTWRLSVAGGLFIFQKVAVLREYK